MVAYGKKLKKARRVGWEGAYLRYDELKTLLEDQLEAALLLCDDDYEAMLQSRALILESLEQEIEKVSLFVLSRQGELADAVGALRFPNSPLLGSFGVEDEVSEPIGSSNGRLKTLLPDKRPMFRASSKILPLDDSTTPTDAIQAYTNLAVELLHLLRFICVNAVAIRKFVKKYDKIVASLDITAYENENAMMRPFEHVQQLANSASIAAIHASLMAALQKQQQQVASAPSESTPDAKADEVYALLRLQCAIDAIHVLREYAQIVNEPFQAFLSRKAMIQTGDNRRELEEALQRILRFDPDSIKNIPDAELLEWKSRLVQEFTAIVTTIQGDEFADGTSWGGVNRPSMVINLASTLLYTVNYYIIAPTANHYALLLGTDGAFGSTLIGASSLSALFAAFLYSYWYTKSSFRSALLFSAICPCLGNLLYAAAISYESMAIAISGRIMVGFGSAEVVNRQLISACVSFSSMTRACALFVAAGAIGMGLGPLMAAILEYMAGTDLAVDLKLPLMAKGGIIVNHVTSPGLVMAALWLLELLAIAFLFREPQRINGGGAVERDSIYSDRSIEYGTPTKYGSGTISFSSFVESEKESFLSRDSDTFPVAKHPTSFGSRLSYIYSLVFHNVALPVTLFLFSLIELVDEVLISSCSMVCRRYFGWKGSVAGFLIASLGSLVLPAHYFVERASRFYSERRIMKYSLVFISVCLFAILNLEGLVYDAIGDVDGKNAVVGGNTLKTFLNKEGEFQYDWGAGKYVYITFLSAIFVGTIVLEGVDTSIMSKVTPPMLNDTFINCGLLATLVGTLGRVAGDSTITISALVDKNIFTDFVNATFFPMIPLVLLGYFLVLRYYKMFV